MGMLNARESPSSSWMEESLLKQQVPRILTWANTNLPQKGILREGPDGFVYLKVDNDYIYKILPLLNLPDYITPPYFRRKNSPGAHISVIYVKERKNLPKITELGKTFLFELSTFKMVPPKRHKYVVLTVSSPDLENLRKKYGLSPLLQGHDFHITIGKKDLKDVKE
jgi:hypothetical protein